MRTIYCAICKTNEHTEVLFNETVDFNKIDADIFSARRIPDRIHYRLLHCAQCGLIFSSPILSEKKINKLYRASTVTYDQEVMSLKETYGNYLLQAMKYTKLNPHILEIGAGNGFFLEKAKDLGFSHVSGIEPGKQSVAMARPDIKKHLIVDFFPSLKVKPNSQDIICTFQTLDHSTDPNAFLTSCHKALKKDGLVLCILHDTQGLSVKLLNENSPIFDIEHIFLFNKSNLKQIFLQNGFTPIEVMNVKNTFPLRYWLRMLPFPRSIRPILNRALKILGLDALPITLFAGNIGIIARKQ